MVVKISRFFFRELKRTAGIGIIKMPKNWAPEFCFAKVKKKPEKATSFSGKLVSYAELF